MTAAWHLVSQHILAAAACCGRVVLVGLGAVGSPTADTVARHPAVHCAILIDPDRVDAGNLRSQLVLPTDVNYTKVSVHRRRMRRINPALAILTWCRRVQSVPLGALRGAIIVCAPDSREVRRYLSEVAWYLGAVLIDAGVEASGDLLRVVTYVPGPEAACGACLMTDDDYRQLEQRFPCRDAVDPTTPTNARFSLTLAASAHQTLELDKVLSGAHDHLLTGRQLVMDCRHHRHFVTTLRRNPACRFPHDPPWSIMDFAQTPAEITLEQVLAGAAASPASATLSVPTTVFVTRLTCRVCGGQRRLLRLANRLRPTHMRCRGCGGEMLAGASDIRSRLGADDLPSALRAQPLHALGLERADIVAVSDGDGRRYVQLGRAVHASQGKGAA